MRKQIVVAFLIVVLMFSLCFSVFAEARSKGVAPVLTFSGTTATCSVTIVKAGADIDATLELWQGNTLVKSWDFSGTSYASVSKTQKVTSGKSYTLKVTATVDGEAISSTPVTKTCP